MSGLNLPGWAIVVIVCVVCGTITTIVSKIIDSKKERDEQALKARNNQNSPDGINVNVNVDNVDDYIKLKDYEKENGQCPFCGARAGVGKDGVCPGCGGRIG